ncbi:MAG: FlgD immunoglobulin-like domain containing protein [Rhodothermales bacterium]
MRQTRTYFARGIRVTVLLVATLAAHQAAYAQEAAPIVRAQKINDTEGGFGGTLKDRDFFGNAVASLGDLDGDGFHELAVGASDDNNSGAGIQRGAVWILSLDENGTVQREVKITATEVSRAAGRSEDGLDGAKLGVSLATLEDLNGDGIPELAVGADRDGEGGDGRGAVWVLFLGENGSLKQPPQKISAASNDFLAGDLGRNYAFGRAVVSLGDLGGDGFFEIAVGAEGDDTGGTNRGAVWILSLDADGAVQGAPKNITSEDLGVMGGLEDGDLFGTSLASLAYDGNGAGDNIPDLAVGARGDDGGSESASSDRGAVWVLALNIDGTLSRAQKISAAEGNFPADDLDDGDAFGISLAGLGDFDLDDSPNLAIGARGDDGAESEDRDFGAVWLVALNRAGDVKGTQKISADNSALAGQLAAGDLFGRSVADLGDINGDGVTDLAVGATGDGGANRGAVWVLQGGFRRQMSDLAITNNASAASISVGDEVTFTVEVTNNGFPDATSIEVIDQLPEGLAYVSHEVSRGTYDRSSGLWTVGELIDRASATLTLVARGETAGQWPNRAEITRSFPQDPDSSNNAAEAVVTVVGEEEADVSLSMRAAPSAVPVDGEVTLTLEVTKGGPQDATSIEIKDELPEGLVYVEAEQGGSYDEGSRSISWRVAELAVGDTTVLTLRTRGESLGEWINKARITASAPEDPDDSNNAAEAFVTVTEADEADVSITVMASQDSATVNVEFAFIVTVTNGGPSTATGIEVANELPEELEVISADPDGNHDAGSRRVTWAIDELAGGSSATLMLVVRATDAGTFTSEAVVTASTPEDPDPANNMAAATVAVTNRDACNDPCTVHVASEQTAWQGGTSESAYRLLSIPYQLDDAGARAVLEDDLGTYDREAWRFFELLPPGQAGGEAATEGQAYREGPGGIVMVPGKAFFLITREAATLTMGSGNTVRLNMPFEVDLHQGWNYIGNPFNQEVPFTNLSLASGAAPQLQTYQGGSWERHTGSLARFEGYAINVEQAEGDKLIVVPPASVLSTKAASLPEEAYEWAIQIRAQIDGARDVYNTAAVAPNALAGRDRLDWHEPPTIGRYVSVSFPHERPGERRLALAADVRPELTEGDVWPVEVRSNLLGPVELDFGGIERVPARFEVWLIDEALGTRQNLRQQPQYVAASAGESRPKRLKLVVGTRAFAGVEVGADQEEAVAFGLEPGYPNPFRGATTIRYGLPEARPVTMTVYNLLGAEVARLVDGEDRPVGRHAVVWDGRDGAGQLVANGMYVCRLEAGTFSAVQTLTLVR